MYAFLQQQDEVDAKRIRPPGSRQGIIWILNLKSTRTLQCTIVKELTKTHTFKAGMLFFKKSTASLKHRKWGFGVQHLKKYHINMQLTAINIYSCTLLIFNKVLQIYIYIDYIALATVPLLGPTCALVACSGPWSPCARQTHLHSHTFVARSSTSTTNNTIPGYSPRKGSVAKTI